MAMEVMSSKRFEYELRKIEIEMLLTVFGKLEELKEKILQNDRFTK